MPIKETRLLRYNFDSCLSNENDSSAPICIMWLPPRNIEPVLEPVSVTDRYSMVSYRTVLDPVPGLQNFKKTPPLFMTKLFYLNQIQTGSEPGGMHLYGTVSYQYDIFFLFLNNPHSKPFFIGKPYQLLASMVKYTSNQTDMQWYRKSWLPQIIMSSRHFGPSLF